MEQGEGRVDAAPDTGSGSMLTVHIIHATVAKIIA